MVGLTRKVPVAPVPLRLHLRVRGSVQGVGFRPFVYRLAKALALSGWVRNDSVGVEIAVQGPADGIAAFRLRLREDSPPLARIDAIDEEHGHADITAESGFTILESRNAGEATTTIGHDTGVCDDCLDELFDPADRRYRHAFINCTQCGPRYTLTRGLPYDRAMTSMAAFSLCAACTREYGDPGDRRFHAEPNACPACGPRLALLDATGQPLDAADPIAATLARLQRGEIVAIKGLGGFHLACDAHNPEAVARLRQRKQRDGKPFAILVANTASAAPLALLDEASAALLASPECPIVLLPKRAGFDVEHPGIAPGLARVGLMLPATPIQHLLFHEAAGRPVDPAWREAAQPLRLVMTSANPGGETLVTGNTEALVRLQGIADALLVHDRDIVVRCDDSVLHGDGGDVPRFVRRARGYTPRPIRLARAGPPVLALSAGLKTTVCLTRGAEAFVSQHLGDLDNASTCAFLVEAVDHLRRLLGVRPARLAHDLHPDFFSTRHAAELAEVLEVPCIGVQHHHAHIAAVLAEHGHEAPALGLALDGIGLGSDGRAWGGELLRVDGADFERLGHLRELPLPGGDRAAREPWRMAAAALWTMGRGGTIATRFAERPAAIAMEGLLGHERLAPPTSSMGRCFDAAAGLLGVCAVAGHEGEAAMRLEALAEAYGPWRESLAAWHIDDANQLDLLPLLAVLADETDAGRGAALFHATLAAALAAWVLAAARRTGLTTVALGGGCFLNAVLSRALARHLRAASLRVLVARELPPSDAGIALGQAWVAQRHLLA